MPSSSTRVSALLADLASALGEVGARWYLFGAQASIVHGASRLTADVDVTVDLTGVSRRKLLAALKRRGFVLEFEDPDFVDVTRVIPLVHRPTHMPVDLVLSGPGLEDLFFERAVRVKIGRRWIVVASPEDVISMKILSGRAKDLDDVEALLVARRDDLDHGVIRETLTIAETMLDQSDLLPMLDRLLGRVRPKKKTTARKTRTARKKESSSGSVGTKKRATGKGQGGPKGRSRR